MNNLTYLLALEWKKFRNNSVYRSLMLIYFILSPVVIFLGKDIHKYVPVIIQNSSVFFEFPTVWDYQGYAGNWMVSMCLGFLAIHIVTSEVSNRTMRQNIISGLTRQEYFMSKITHVVAIGLAASAVYGLSSVLIGMIHTDGFDLELVLDNNRAVLRYFLMCLGYMIFGLMLAFLIRRGFLTLMVYFFYVFALEPIFMAIHVYYFKNSSRNYWPMNCTEDLMPLPLYRLPDFFTSNEWDFNILLSYKTAALMTILYTLVFAGIARWSFYRKDV